MADKGEDVPEDIILVEDDDDDDDQLGSSGPQNMDEAQAYQDRLNKTLEDFAELLNEDRKDVLKVTIQSWKHLISRHWSIMAQADVDMVMKSIADPTCIMLKQCLSPGGVEAVDLPEDVPTEEFLRRLPDRKCKQKVGNP